MKDRGKRLSPEIELVLPPELIVTAPEERKGMDPSDLIECAKDLFREKEGWEELE